MACEDAGTLNGEREIVATSGNDERRGVKSCGKADSDIVSARTQEYVGTWGRKEENSVKRVAALLATRDEDAQRNQGTLLFVLKTSDIISFLFTIPCVVNKSQVGDLVFDYPSNCNLQAI